MLGSDYIKDGTAIYERSFAIIRAEADLSRFSPDEAEIAIRMIHACGQVEAARHFVFSPGFVAAARAALNAGAPIFCDAEMVAHGVTRARLPAEQRSRLHAARPAHRRASPPGSATRAPPPRSNCGAIASPVRWWRSATRRPRCSICSTRSAPAGRSRRRSSACRSASSARRNRRMRWPDDRFGIPFAIVRGRMGGSAMTAAAVNAIARAGL